MSAYELPSQRKGLDSFALVGLVLIAFGGWVLFRDISSTRTYDLVINDGYNHQPLMTRTVSQEFIEKAGSYQGNSAEEVIESRIAAPYEQYVLTQGLHGYSYGHMAIDLSAGKGTVIKSPVDGHVAERYVDQYGNPTLVIENDYFRITMLHGKYKVEVGDRVRIGQMVGRESNLGFTTDIWGRSCRNRDCGYHTHLNIFDKRTGSNINPLEVIE